MIFLPATISPIAHRLALHLLIGALICVVSESAYADDEQAQKTPPKQESVTRPPVIEVPHTALTPDMKADLDDPAWRTAALIPSLSLSVGADARPQALPTSVHILWDEKFLYFRFTCRDDEIHSPFTGRDQPLYQADVVEVFLDAKGDGRQYLEVEVSPHNQVFDQLFTLTADAISLPDGRLGNEVLHRDWWSNLSYTLDGFRSATAKFNSKGAPVGWLCDMAVPAAPLLRRLGRTTLAPMTLRANVLRYDWMLTQDPKNPRARIPMNWAPVSNGVPHISPQAMGFLQLLPKAQK